MKTIRNTTREPIRVPLGGGKVLHLGPGHTGNVSLSASERPAFVKLLDAGRIEFVDQAETAASDIERKRASSESTHGRKSTRLRRTGDR